jgi:Lrp/AsnC family leucine-responsive transcriptional regulator
MDKIDWKILTELEGDGRLSFAELGEKVALSKSPCWSRVRDLERAGVIRGYTATIDPASVGLTVNCLISVRISFDMHDAFERAVLDHPAIMECYTTAGDSDYILRIHARSVEHLDTLLRHDLAKLPGVHRLTTTLCLKAIKPDASLAKWAATLD